MTGPMDTDELERLARDVFCGAMRDAANNGETVTEDRRDEHFWQTASGPDLLRAAAAYFADQ